MEKIISDKAEKVLFFSDGEEHNSYLLGQRINKEINPQTKIKIISGFLTVKGFYSLMGKKKDQKIKAFEKKEEDKIEDFGRKLEYLLVGRLTKQSADFFDKYYQYNGFKGKLFINYGLGKENTKERREIFEKGEFLYLGYIQKFSPLIHCKIIALDHGNDKENLFYIGSANMTSFALENNNAEAGIIIKGLDNNERDIIYDYMKKLRFAHSTISYDPKYRNDLIKLHTLSVMDDLKSISGVFPSPPSITYNILLILCYNPLRYKVGKNDNLFTDILTTLPELMINYNRALKRKNYVIFMLFENLYDLFLFNFDSAQKICAKIGSIYDSSSSENRPDGQQIINGLFIYFKELLPIIIPYKKVPLDKPEENDYAVRYNVLSNQNILDLFSNNMRENLVIKKQSEEKHKYKAVEWSDNRFRLEEDIFENEEQRIISNFLELKYFEVVKRSKTLSDIIDERMPLIGNERLKPNKEKVEILERKIIKFFNELSNKYTISEKNFYKNLEVKYSKDFSENSMKEIYQSYEKALSLENFIFRIYRIKI